jgi:hypothetical protein
MASVQSTIASHGACGAGHGHATEAAMSGGHHDDDDDDDHKKHHAASLSGHDDDDDDHHKKHHAANDDAGRPSFFARLFRRYP